MLAMRRWAPLPGQLSAVGQAGTGTWQHQMPVPAPVQHCPGTAGTTGWQSRGAVAQAVPAVQQYRTSTVALARARVPECPPAAPPVPAPCPPGTVIVQLLHGRGRSPGAVCVSKGLCGKITQAEEEEEEEGESPPLAFTAMPGLWAQ